MKSDIIYTIKRSKRKTTSISISVEGKVTISCPLKTSDEAVRRLVKEKSAWIIKKLNEIDNRPKQQQHSFLNGECFMLFGKKFLLRVVPTNDSARANTVHLMESEQIIEVYCTPDAHNKSVRESLLKWYIGQLDCVINNRFEYFSKLLQVSPKKVYLKELKSCWGSCSSKGNVSINWRLVMAPPHILDYVVVHELCHMREMNHSERFWKWVASVYPDYKQARAWLKKNSRMLVF